MHHSLVTIIADVMPMDMVIKKLEEGIEKYKTSGIIEDLGPACLVLLTKITISQHKGGAHEMIADMEKLVRASKLLDPGVS